MKKILLSLLVSFFPLLIFAQGLYNQGAHIVLSGGAYLNISGSTGNYLNTDNGTNYGRITNTSSTILVGGNWTNNSADPTDKVFTTNSGTVNLDGGAQTIGGSASTNFNNLTLAGTANSTKTLGVNTTVGGGFTSPAGVLALGTDELALNHKTLTITNTSTAAITHTSGQGHIKSELTTAVTANTSNYDCIVDWDVAATGSYVYPFGTGFTAATAIPVTINKTAGTATDIALSTGATPTTDNKPWMDATDVAAVSYMNPTQGNITNEATQAVIDRWWDITPTASSTLTANVTFSYLGSENTMTYAPTGTIVAQHWTGSLWNDGKGGGSGTYTTTGAAGSQAAGAHSVTATGLTQFSPFVLSAQTAPLPIELLNLEANCDHKDVDVSWTTASETNNDYFTVQKSLNGTSNFQNVATVNGAGNSTTTLNYSVTDYNPFQGISYYRLKQTDFDGQSTYSSLVTAGDCASSGDAVNVMNNDYNQISVFIDSHSQQKYFITLYDMRGRKVLAKTAYVDKGHNTIHVNASSIGTGLYFMAIESQSNVFNKKVYLH